MARGFDRCLAHLEAADLDRFLQRLKPGADLDVVDVGRTSIDAGLLGQVLKAVQDENGRSVFGSWSFDRACFSDDASFIGVQFTGNVSFKGTRFTGYVSFEGAQFDGGASFGDLVQFDTGPDYVGAQFDGGASFEGTQFTRDAAFHRAGFTGEAVFKGARFTGGAVFKGARFAGGASFETAQFTEHAVFDDAEFAGHTTFGGAQFTGGASFGAAQFTEHAVFEGAEFTRDAVFNRAEFTKDALFNHAQFGGAASFGELVQFIGPAVFRYAQFGGDADFTCAEFRKGADFTAAQFPRATSLGPLTAQKLTLDEALFDRQVVIEAVAKEVSCRRTTWKGGVTLGLRYATVDLEWATLTQSSSITGSDRPLPSMRLARDTIRESRPTLWNDDEPAWFGLFAEDQADSLRSAWIPSLWTLRGVDADNLTVTDVDLSNCHFAGALKLDQLRLEGRYKFDRPPVIGVGRAWLPVWRWSSRRSLFEERLWRATTGKYWGWSNTRSEDAEVGPDRLAVLYRQLRKAQEDAKNEPGAADFYYGEMEMRRHAPSTTWAERFILAAYWAVSGYGLRATRAFAALAILIAGSAIVLQYAGFPGHTPAYLDSLLYAAGSVLSLNLTIGHLPAVLTHWGDVIRMLLRIAGPVLLGLAALALRGRVKR
jgi:uncharacterized protein YjbI with pentapeptide repeats